MVDLGAGRWMKFIYTWRRGLSERVAAVDRCRDRSVASLPVARVTTLGIDIQEGMFKGLLEVVDRSPSPSSMPD